MPNDIPLWTVGWSHDGRLVAGVTKKGFAYVWDPRAGVEPTKSVDLSTTLQALKPVHLVWVGGDVFITSFSRTRTRQYSLHAGTDLSTVFTASLDTSQGPVLAAVDHERRIVYAAGRGDMILRQIELSGPQGYQEMRHPIPSPLSSGLALAHWSNLAVMEAQIACVLIPTTDKDGDCILPIQIKVPRRQLIDYHDDLYPDEVSSVPEQNAKQWLAGGDGRPLPVSLNPERRGEWERSVGAGKGKWSKSTSTSKPAEVQPATAPATTAPTSAKAVFPSDIEKMERVETPAALKPTGWGKSGESPPAKAAPAPASAPLGATSAPKEGETASSTSYKVRLISDFLDKFTKEYRASGSSCPLMVGLQGPQGCGKTTLCNGLVGELSNRGLKAAVLSLDDLYRTHDGLKQLAEKHPDNPLLSGRGPPGTHDVELATRVLNAVQHINESSTPVDLPIFDKSLCDGQGDRSKDTVQIKAPIDIFVLEGWSMGFAPLSTDALEKRIKAKDGKYFTQQTEQSLSDLNTYLSEVVTKVYPCFKVLVQVEPDSYENVFKWRLEQEHHMKKENGGRGMTDDEVRKFVERYMPAYELWAETVLNADAPWAGRVVRLRYGKDREVVAVENPESQVQPEVVKPGNVKDAVANNAPTGVKQNEQTKVVKPEDSSRATSTIQSATPTPPPAAAPSTTPALKQTSAAKDRYNPGWSRKYMAGKSPLKPTYDQVPSLATLHQDSLVLRVTPHLALFPIQGPGGRLCVHPLSKKGRIPVGGVGYLSGGVGIADFDADPFGDLVVLAGEDGVLRGWNVGPEGIEGAGPEPAKVVRGEGVDKVVQLSFHPTAQNLLLVASNDQGKAHLRFFDLSTGKEEKVVALDAPGVTGFAISPEGDRIALATQDKQVIVLKGDKQTKGKAHDSLRSSQFTWAGDHLISLGFGRGSMRSINLYAVEEDVTTIATLDLDVSPSVLFPQYDPDTSILYVWGKGQQAIAAFEIHPDASERIAKLPVFTAGSPQLGIAFLPKQEVDVKKVEVTKALRLTARTIEEVSFTIPRNKPQFFQDDIYVPTMNTATATTTAAEWLAGKRAAPAYVSLQPDDMTPRESIICFADPSLRSTKGHSSSHTLRSCRGCPVRGAEEEAGNGGSVRQGPSRRRQLRRRRASSRRHPST